MQGDVAHEPKYALVASKNGLEDITKIISQAQYVLKSKGWLLIEHGYDQAQSVQTLMKNNQFISVITYPDLASKDRITVGQKQ
jgi:release factor glutamine methyltransferase